MLKFGQKLVGHPKYVTIQLISKFQIDNPNPDADNVQHEIRWGPRAHAEIKKSQLLMIISSLYGCQPKDFKQQFTKIVAEEGEDCFVVDEPME